MPGRTRQKLNSAGEPRGGNRRSKKPEPERQTLEPRPVSAEHPRGQTGRRKIVLDLEEFQKLCSIQCTLVEIADWYGCSEATIKKRIKEEPEFEEAWKHGMAHGRISIRRAQMRAVQDPNCKGHATMLVWLGKIFLNQKDSQEVNLNTDNAKHGPYQHPFVTEDEATSTEVPDGESQLH